MGVVISLNPPAKRENRSTSLNIRLTKSERALIETLAQKYEVSPSYLGRYFIMQCVSLDRGENPISEPNNGGAA